MPPHISAKWLENRKDSDNKSEGEKNPKPKQIHSFSPQRDPFPPPFLKVTNLCCGIIASQFPKVIQTIPTNFVSLLVNTLHQSHPYHFSAGLGCNYRGQWNLKLDISVGDDRLSGQRRGDAKWRREEKDMLKVSVQHLEKNTYFSHILTFSKCSTLWGYSRRHSQISYLWF